MKKLKPCPFCGSEAETTYNLVYGFQVFCANEYCFMNTVTMDGMETEHDAVEAWNRKANDALGQEAPAD